MNGNTIGFHPQTSEFEILLNTAFYILNKKVMISTRLIVVKASHVGPAIS